MDGKDVDNSHNSLLGVNKEQQYQMQKQIREQRLNELAELNQTKILLLARKQRLEQDINFLKQRKYLTENPTNYA